MVEDRTLPPKFGLSGFRLLYDRVGAGGTVQT